MIVSVALGTQKILEHISGRPHTLLITGHSAGGAIASLLYTHMRSTRSSSPLVELASGFRRVHCITFGTPRVSLRPLQKPSHPACEKDMFVSFINEGDIVPRVDSWKYVLPLLHHARRAAKRRGHLRFANTMESLQTPQPILCVPGCPVLLRQKVSSKTKIEATRVSDRDLSMVSFLQIKEHFMELYSWRINQLANIQR